MRKNPGHAGYPEARQARKIMERSKKVILCVAGHVHWNTFNQINGIPYLSLHSLTESFTTPPDPSGAWAFLEIGERIDWTVYGKRQSSSDPSPANPSRRMAAAAAARIYSPENRPETPGQHPLCPL